VRLLCVSDIHGNLAALAAVLATAEKTSFHRLLVAGDLLFPGPDPLETWRRLVAAQATLVQGATDRALTILDVNSVPTKTAHEREVVERMKTVRSELGDIILERLRRVPTHNRVPLEDGTELLLVHGSPVDPFEPMTFDMTDDELNALIGDDPADVIVCGMSHTPFDRMVGDVRIINVGSVGEAPDARKEGDPPKVAHATWLDSTPAGLDVSQISVPLTEDDEA
jgi:predicted phosphodiesterase